MQCVWVSSLGKLFKTSSKSLVTEGSSADVQVAIVFGLMGRALGCLPPEKWKNQSPLRSPAKWKLNNYWPLVVISTLLKPWSYNGRIEIEKMNTGFGHLTIFLIGEAKLREVMETVLPRVLPVDVTLKPFSVLEFSQVWATFNWKFWEFWRKHI